MRVERRDGRQRSTGPRRPGQQRPPAASTRAPCSCLRGWGGGGGSAEALGGSGGHAPSALPTVLGLPAAAFLAGVALTGVALAGDAADPGAAPGATWPSSMEVVGGRQCLARESDRVLAKGRTHASGGPSSGSGWSRLSPPTLRPPPRLLPRSRRPSPSSLRESSSLAASSFSERPPKPRGASLTPARSRLPPPAPRVSADFNCPPQPSARQRLPPTPHPRRVRFPGRSRCLTPLLVWFSRVRIRIQTTFQKRISWSQSRRP